MIITNYNKHKHELKKCRKIEGFSVTIPSQAMSIREIFDRFNQGIPLDLVEQRAIFDKLTLDDFDVLDVNNYESMADLYNQMSDVQKRAHLEKWLDKPEPPSPEPPSPPAPPEPDMSE